MKCVNNYGYFCGSSKGFYLSEAAFNLIINSVNYYSGKIKKASRTPTFSEGSILAKSDIFTDKSIYFPFDFFSPESKVKELPLEKYYKMVALPFRKQMRLQIANSFTLLDDDIFLSQHKINDLIVFGARYFDRLIFILDPAHSINIKFTSGARGVAAIRDFEYKHADLEKYIGSRVFVPCFANSAQDILEVLDLTAITSTKLNIKSLLSLEICEDDYSSLVLETNALLDSNIKAITKSGSFGLSQYFFRRGLLADNFDPREEISVSVSISRFNLFEFN